MCSECFANRATSRTLRNFICSLPERGVPESRKPLQNKLDANKWHIYSPANLFMSVVFEISHVGLAGLPPLGDFKDPERDFGVLPPRPAHSPLVGARRASPRKSAPGPVGSDTLPMFPRAYRPKGHSADGPSRLSSREPGRNPGLHTSWRPKCHVRTIQTRLNTSYLPPEGL